jgi:HK97 gp10 family phage protein
MDEFRIEGLDVVLGNFKEVKAQMRNKAVRAAARKGANVIRDAAKAGWRAVDRQETPNSIADNVAVQFAGRTFRRTGDIMFRVGIRGGAKSYVNNTRNRRMRRVGEKYNTGGTTFYWRFYELGTSTQPARPVMQPALFNNAGKALAAFVQEMDRQFKRLGKGPG